VEQAQFSTIKYNGLIDIIVIILQPDGPGEVRQRDRAIQREERGQEAGLYTYISFRCMYCLIHC
jgi:hypothetical protein